jgi:Uncharacterized protein conserved in bacteria
MSIHDEQARERTLSRGEEAYSVLLPPTHGCEQAVVLLGLGPLPQDALPTEDRHVHVAYVEYEPFAMAMPPEWNASIPATWRPISPEQAVTMAASGSEVRLYRQNLRLFNSFWGPLVAAVQASRLDSPGRSPAASTPSVVVPGDDGDLLTKEIEAALTELGYRTVRVPSRETAAVLPGLLRDDRPVCLLSVNGRGLDADGQIVRLAQACGVPTALWLVDNPWHLLSGWTQTWWRDVRLFVTDASFLAPLQAHGARSVHHLPLGAWMRPPVSPYQGEPLRPLVFVGRSAFPDKQKFFSGLRCDPLLLDEARRYFHASRLRPDFDWWTDRLGFTSLWPGKASRRLGLHAETASQAYRAAWLYAAESHGLTVFGDSGWRDILPCATLPPDVRPPVDYYGGLASIYASARFSLNMTSLLLPHGLTQRHFDVWSAGGFLLTDATPGLSLFPEELTREIRLAHPDDLGAAVQRFERDPSLYQNVRAAWELHIRSEHTIINMMKTLINSF